MTFRPRALCIFCAIALIMALSLVLSLLAPAPVVAQDLGNMMEGMSVDQVSTFMEIARKVICPCGCGEGTLMDCRINDPTCGTSKRLLNTAVGMVKVGQKASTIIAALAKPSAPAAPVTPRAAAAPAKSVALEIGDSPIMGKAGAKVTILEFSDFQ